MNKGVYNRTKRVLGLGINDADYVTQTYEVVGGVRKKLWSCPYYMRWYDMLKRVTGRANPRGSNNSYEGVAISEEWKTFSKFKDWMEQQDWEDKHLDKDLLSEGVRIYSEDTCVFLGRNVNNFLIERGFDRGDCPIGVSRMNRAGLKKPYQSCISIRGDRVRLGYYTTPEEAHNAWQVAKYNYGVELMNEQTDVRVKEALRKILSSLKYQYENGIITESLLKTIDTPSPTVF